MSNNSSVRRSRRGLSVATAVVLVGGCGGANPPPADTSSADRALLESAERPLQRAHDAEEISAQRKTELDQKIEQAE